jgi:hypothetical protein
MATTYLTNQLNPASLSNHSADSGVAAHAAEFNVGVFTIDDLPVPSATQELLPIRP